MSQKFTSAKTSINGKCGKIPAAYGFDIPAGSTVLDYGCGDDLTVSLLEKHANDKGINWFGFDPYNRSEKDNDKVLSIGSFDYGICSNVLNVIDDIKTVVTVINNVMKLSNVGVFTVYEGDKSGRGKQTGVDQWQRNEPISKYINLIKGLGYEVNRKGKLIFVS